MDTLGEKLRELRIEKNLSIEVISNITKIRPQYIIAIEENKFSILPGVYVKSFIRTYANVLKYDLNELEKELNLIFQSQVKPQIYQETSQSESIVNRTEFKSSKKHKFKTAKSNNFINYFIYAGLIIASVILLYFSFFGDSSPRMNDLTDEFKKESDTAIIKEPKKEILQFFQASDSLIVEAKATDSAWLRVDIDGKKVDTGLMTPGMIKRWSAMKYVIINLGNAGAINFTRNGVELGYFGSKGTVIRNLKITRDTVVSSATPWDDAKPKKIREQDTKALPPIIEPSRIEPLKLEKQKDS